jgi:hypothetical protein
MAFDFAREVWRKHPTPLGWKPATSSNRGKVSTNVGPKWTTLHRSVSFSLSVSLQRTRKTPTQQLNTIANPRLLCDFWTAIGIRCRNKESVPVNLTSFRPQTNLIVSVKRMPNGSSKLACRLCFGWRFTGKHCESSLGLLFKWNTSAVPCKRTCNVIWLFGVINDTSLLANYNDYLAHVVRVNWPLHYILDEDMRRKTHYVELLWAGKNAHVRTALQEHREQTYD